MSLLLGDNELHTLPSLLRQSYGIWLCRNVERRLYSRPSWCNSNNNRALTQRCAQKSDSRAKSNIKESLRYQFSSFPLFTWQLLLNLEKIDKVTLDFSNPVHIWKICCSMLLVRSTDDLDSTFHFTYYLEFSIYKIGNWRFRICVNDRQSLKSENALWLSQRAIPWCIKKQAALCLSYI